MADLPLIRHFSANTTFAWRGAQRVTAGQFVQHAARIAAELPDTRYALNLCIDRYSFAVALAAALMRRQVTLLPPNDTPATIAQILATYGDTCRLVDDMRGKASGAIAVGDPPPVNDLPLDPVALDERAVAAIVFTSGSTGQPEPQPKTWGTLVQTGTVECERLGLAGGARAAILATVPPQHMYGLESSVLMAMQGGNALHAGRPFYPADVCAELEALPRPRVLVTTPVHLRAVLEGSNHVPAADLLVCATAPLSPKLAARAEASFDAPLHEIYGCTETGQLATRHTVRSPEWQAFPGIRLRQDEKGTWACGGHVTDETLLHDMIELKGRDRFLLHGRNADMVNVAGKRTSLAHLNYHLNSIDGVQDGVFILPEDTPDRVSRLAAFVVAPALSSDALLGLLRERIDAAFLPRPLVFVDTLPRNATGKLPRAAVEALMGELATGDK